MAQEVLKKNHSLQHNRLDHHRDLVKKASTASEGSTASTSSLESSSSFDSSSPPSSSVGNKNETTSGGSSGGAATKRKNKSNKAPSEISSTRFTGGPLKLCTTTTKIIRPAPLKKFPNSGSSNSSAGSGTEAQAVGKICSLGGSSKVVDATGKTAQLQKTQQQSHSSQQQQQTSQRQQRAALEQKRKAAVEARLKRQQEEKKRHQLQCSFPPHPQHHLVPVVMALNDRTTAPNSNGPDSTNPASPYHQRQIRSSSINSATSSNTSKQQQQQHLLRPATTEAPIDVVMDTTSPVPPTPLFERLVTEEVQELRSYARIIESQNRRLSDLERIHDDLEARLELQTKERMDLEAKLDEQNRLWGEKFADLEKECNKAKQSVMLERARNERLLEEINKKDKEIHKMMQRKYDAKNPHGQPITHAHFPTTTHHHRGTSNIRRSDSARVASSSQSSSTKQKVVQHKSPHEILVASGSADTVRERNVAHSLLDFFGM